MKYLLLLFTTLIFACNTSDFQQEKDIVNELIVEYDSLFNAINRIDIQSAKTKLKKYNESLEYSKSQLSSEKKPSPETMNFMNDMKLMKRQFKNASSTKNNLISSTARNQEQLKNLINDISNGVFEKEDIELIISREQQALKELSIETSNFEESYKNADSRFDSLYELSKTFQYN